MKKILFGLLLFCINSVSYAKNGEIQTPEDLDVSDYKSLVSYLEPQVGTVYIDVKGCKARYSKNSEEALRKVEMLSSENNNHLIDQLRKKKKTGFTFHYDRYEKKSNIANIVTLTSENRSYYCSWDWVWIFYKDGTFTEIDYDHTSS